MRGSKRTRLERAGWRVGTVQEFLNLSDEESEVLELKLALSNGLRTSRANKHLTQTQLAKRLATSSRNCGELSASQLANYSRERACRALGARAHAGGTEQGEISGADQGVLAVEIEDRAFGRSRGAAVRSGAALSV